MSDETLAATIKHGPIRFIYGWAGRRNEKTTAEIQIGRSFFVLPKYTWFYFW